jgi:FKBP-type peptidyl-prolyl cis-trans isomerase
MLVIGVASGLLELGGAAENKPAAPAPAAPQVRPAPAAPELPAGFKDQKEQMSYSLGMNIGGGIKQSGVELDLDVLTGAMRDMVAGHEMRLSDVQMREGVRAFQMAANAKREEERLRLADKNHKLGEAFLAENKKKEGVKTHTVTLPDGKTMEMQYKVITEGTGAVPKSNDLVNVTYRGTLITGKEFDNSAKRGPGAAKYMAGRAPFRGWSEAWQMMKVGSKWELYLPSALARGDYALPPDVEPGSTLIYEMELTGIEAPPASPQPLTSDIVKVPSAEDLKKGVQPKILKPEDVEKEMQSEKNQKKQ